MQRTQLQQQARTAACMELDMPSSGLRLTRWAWPLAHMPSRHGSLRTAQTGAGHGQAARHLASLHCNCRADAAPSLLLLLSCPLISRPQFTRSTTKYWVHPSNLLRLKLALTKQLPLLVYGADDPVSSGDIAAAAAEGADGAPASQQHKVTSLVSSGVCAWGVRACSCQGGCGHHHVVNRQSPMSSTAHHGCALEASPWHAVKLAGLPGPPGRVLQGTTCALRLCGCCSLL